MLPARPIRNLEPAHCLATQEASYSVVSLLIAVTAFSLVVNCLELEVACWDLIEIKLVVWGD